MTSPRPTAILPTPRNIRIRLEYRNARYGNSSATQPRACVETQMSRVANTRCYIYTYKANIYERMTSGLHKYEVTKQTVIQRILKAEPFLTCVVHYLCSQLHVYALYPPWFHRVINTCYCVSYWINGDFESMTNRCLFMNNKGAYLSHWIISS